MIYSSEFVSFYIFLNGRLVSQFRVFDLILDKTWQMCVVILKIMTFQEKMLDNNTTWQCFVIEYVTLNI